MRIILLILISACSNIKIPEVPIYGNYCGPGYPKSQNTAGDPIDDLDKSCKIHDECYAKMGYFNKNCDLELIQDLKNSKIDTVKQAVYRNLMSDYFISILRIRK